MASRFPGGELLLRSRAPGTPKLQSKSPGWRSALAWSTSRPLTPPRRSRRCENRGTPRVPKRVDWRRLLEGGYTLRLLFRHRSHFLTGWAAAVCAAFPSAGHQSPPGGQRQGSASPTMSLEVQGGFFGLVAAAKPPRSGFKAIRPTAPPARLQASLGCSPVPSGGVLGGVGSFRGVGAHPGPGRGRAPPRAHGRGSTTPFPPAWSGASILTSCPSSGSSTPGAPRSLCTGSTSSRWRGSAMTISTVWPRTPTAARSRPTAGSTTVRSSVQVLR